MVIYGVEDDTDASLVERLYHFLELTDAHLRTIRVGGIASLGHIIVLRIVSPIELWALELRLVHRSEIEQRLEMDGIDAETLQIVDGTRLCQSQILATMLHARSGTDGEIAHVKLVNHEVCRRRNSRTAVVSPSHGVGVSHVDDGATVAVDAYSLSKRAGTLALAYIESIEHATKVALYGSLPAVVAYGTHLDSFDGSATLSCLIDAHFREGSCIETEYGLCLTVFHLVEAPLSIYV